jgi:four helix bundle protein
VNDKVRNFEDLAVYQKARTLIQDVYRLTRDGPFARDFGLMDQIRRAAVSVLSNIAEGYERGSNAELIQFLYIAKGSCGELRAQLMVACDLAYVDVPTHNRLNDEARRVSAMLANLIRHLKTSGFRGPKNKPQE